MTWEGLTPPYATIVADPPWVFEGRRRPFSSTALRADIATNRPDPYSCMSVEQITALPVMDLAAKDAHLYLWTTNRYLRDAYAVAEAWGFRFSKLLTWCKAPMGIGVGGTFVNTAEYVLFCRRGALKAKRRVETTWWQWPRELQCGTHSAKPPAFLDLVEQVSPGPYVELFARQPRFGWDSWGWGYEITERTSG